MEHLLTMVLYTFKEQVSVRDFKGREAIHIGDILRWGRLWMVMK